MRRVAAFTLVEIMIVVSIIAVLATIAMPSFLRARRRAQNTRFANDLRVVTSAFELYAMEHGSYPVNATPGVLPAGMDTYFGPTFDFSDATPIGGNWDWANRKTGALIGVSVVSRRSDAGRLRQERRALHRGPGITSAPKPGRELFLDRRRECDPAHLARVDSHRFASKTFQDQCHRLRSG
jgi:prepilin-type N-terminal cleavage/methylation domain-containing protein